MLLFVLIVATLYFGEDVLVPVVVPCNPQTADVDPPGSLPLCWRGPSAVLCIAGRGPLDEAAAFMLVQLLGKHGLRGRLVGYGDVSREAIDRLDVSGVAMACVSYLGISGSPAVTESVA